MHVVTQAVLDDSSYWSSEVLFYGFPGFNKCILCNSALKLVLAGWSKWWNIKYYCNVILHCKVLSAKRSCFFPPTYLQAYSDRFMPLGHQRIIMTAAFSNRTVCLDDSYWSHKVNNFKINVIAYQISLWLSDFMHPSLHQNCILFLCNVAIVAFGNILIDWLIDWSSTQTVMHIMSGLCWRVSHSLSPPAKNLKHVNLNFTLF